MEFFATCAAGLEPWLAQELRALGCTQLRPLHGQVAWHGSLTTALRACLWSRLASRVHAVIARVAADDNDVFYQGIYDIAWEEQLRVGASFAVDAHGTNSQLKSTRFVEQRTKDAIVDRLRARRGARPPVDMHTPDLHIAVRIAHTKATVAINLAGAPLFLRTQSTQHNRHLPLHPLRCDMAAALLAVSGWNIAEALDERRLLSIFAGSGSVIAEAVALAQDRAAGLLREHWGFDGWMQIEHDAWNELLDEADERAETGVKNQLQCIACDLRNGSREAIEQTMRAHSLRADLHFVEAKRLSALGVADLSVCDLSWMDTESFHAQAAALSYLAQTVDMHGACSALTADSMVDIVLNQIPHTQLHTFIGRTEMSIRAYDANPSSDKHSRVLADTTIPMLVATSDQFAARLKKVAHQRARWAKRTQVSCYRVYDADLPDYKLSIDLFEGSKTPGRWLQIYEYAPPKDIDATLARARLLDAVTIAAHVLDVDVSDIQVRVRRRARGGGQYADEAHMSKQADKTRTAAVQPQKGLASGAHLIDENGLTFEINFDARFDCGLFLDHRLTRQWIKELAAELAPRGRFLNLFAYTGTASCYAASGGLSDTTTVDLSRPSLDWAKRNMARNGFTGSRHRFVQADVLSWIQHARHKQQRWDLVFCDVPTFSNSRRMGHKSFDVQRDHAELLIGVSRLLSAGGLCLFSCNLRSFQPDIEKLERAGVGCEDVTAKTIAEDFARTPNIHHCYLIGRTKTSRA